MAHEDDSDFIEPASDEASLNLEEFVITSDYDPTVAEYPIPNDDTEAGREGLRHALFKELLDGRLHLAPIDEYPQKILDIGTGFGDWAMEMGDKFPSATVVGVDLSPIQPVWIPPNVSFVVDDVEDAWIHGDNYDYIHMRVTACVLKDPIRVILNAFRNLRPGGWIEIQEVYPKVGCIDDTMPADYAPKVFYEKLHDVFREKYGFDSFICERLPGELARLGFVNVQKKVCHIPIGLWAKEKKRMHQAFLLQEVLGEFLPVMEAKPFREEDQGETDREAIHQLFGQVRQALQSKKIHAYLPFHFIYAQKPL